MVARVKTRPAHWLRRTKRKTTPDHFVFFDTETSIIERSEDREKLALRLGWAASWTAKPAKGYKKVYWAYFEQPGAFWDFVEMNVPARGTLYVAAHNVVFDLTVVEWERELMARGWTLVSPYANQNVQIIKVAREKQTIVFFSSTNLFPGKLADWGDALDLPKLPVDFDHADAGYLSAYCRRDVEILLHLFTDWLDFIRTERLGSFKLTVASQAFESYRHRFMPRMIHIHDNKQAIALEREAY